MQNNQGIMQISENKDGSAKVLFRIRKAEMADVDEIMAVMHEAKNDKEHPDWFVSDDEEYVRTHIEEQGFMPVYKRQEITDDLHETCGFRTDYPFITKRKIKRSFFLCLLPRLVNVFEKNPVMKRECEKT